MKEHIDNWRAQDFKCHNCSPTHKGWNLLQGPLRDGRCDLICPQCYEALGRLEFPSLPEMEANLDRMTPENRAAAERWLGMRNDHLLKALHDPNQLPDIAVPNFVLFWNEEDNHELLITFGEHEIYRTHGGYEYYSLFVEACRVFKTRYGEALLDVIPTPRTYLNMWGDRCSADGICDMMRALIRRATRFWGEPEFKVLQGITRQAPKDLWKHFDHHHPWVPPFVPNPRDAEKITNPR
ncbi:MAG: hypothetical protein ACOYMV_10680 [Verrucomicrobiia bacterium]